MMMFRVGSLSAAVFAVSRTYLPLSGLIVKKSVISDISQLTDETMYADLPTVRFVLIPVVVILILAKQSIVRTHIAF